MEAFNFYLLKNYLSSILEVLLTKIISEFFLYILKKVSIRDSDLNKVASPILQKLFFVYSTLFYNRSAKHERRKCYTSAAQVLHK